MVGDYVGGNVVFLDPETLALQDTLPLPVEDQGPGPILRTKPTGVAFMNGRFYVGDERSGFIQVYVKPGAIKPNGKVRKNPKKVGKWKLVSANLTGFAIGGPSDIVADEALGLLFVASKGDKTIYVVDETGAVIRTIGGPGSASPVGQPQGLALDRAGQRMFVSDGGAEVCTWRGCAPASLVRVYDYNGNFRGEISGDSGQENFEFSRVQGVTVNSLGHVYLVDSFRSQVLVFDEVSTNSWAGIGTFGSKGTGPKQLLLPMDVVVDEASSGVYVTNSMQGRVEVFAFGDMETVP
jgi:DNA-binding beta-propeller fold protein YncE